jgi:hypothetical protein
VVGYALKCDIKQYFATVDHEILIGIIGRHIKDDDVLWLVRTILDHYHETQPGKGMPLGNWTSQFLANVYLNELDQHVKHHLHTKYYIRYVDDFVIIDRSRRRLAAHLDAIREFLASIKLDLHPNKCSIIPLRQGVAFLGFRIFYHYRLARRRNVRAIRRRLLDLIAAYEDGQVEHERITITLRGWNAYASHAQTHHVRQRLHGEILDRLAAMARPRVPQR